MNQINTESAAGYVTGIPTPVDKIYTLCLKSEETIIQRAMEILESRLRKKEYSFTNPTDTKNFCRLKLQQLEHEVFSVLFLDNQHCLIEYRELFRGTIDGASVYPREVVKTALQLNAAAVIFTHNHPSGISTPSNADRNITTKLKSGLDLMDIRVLDHIIIGDETYSFAESGLI